MAFGAAAIMGVGTLDCLGLSLASLRGRPLRGLQAVWEVGHVEVGLEGSEDFAKVAWRA